MTATDDDPIASCQERVGTLRKRGRVGAASLTVVPADEIDVRVGRPQAPERLSAEERDLWEQLTFSRPLVFGCRIASGILRDDGLASAAPGGRAAQGKARRERYQRLARLHRQSVALAATLATRLRLTPSAKLDKRTPTDGELPIG